VAVNWAAARGAEDFNALPREGWQWAEGARRFDGPETASYINVAGLIRSAEFLGEIGVDAIHRHITRLLGGLERALPAPFRRRSPPPPTPGPILSIESDEPGRTRRAYARLRESNVRVSLRDDGIRVSPHIYNTEADVERLLEHLGAS
jgi:selenocysteine lyase/cysteine desulfurase